MSDLKVDYGRIKGLNKVKGEIHETGCFPLHMQ
jgi:hypothetical protein